LLIRHCSMLLDMNTTLKKEEIMVLDTEFDVPDRANYKCYKLGNVMYIPHYELPGVFVGPSKRKESKFIRADYVARHFYKSELVKMGATEHIEQLWTTSARDQK